MVKKLYTFLALILCINFSFSQVVSIGNETNTGDNIPVALSYGYTYSQSLYLASEIGQSGTIYRISFEGNSSLGLTNSDNWSIYIGHTTQDVFTSNNWIAASAMTQVFDGTVTEVDNVVTIELTTPFVYNGTDNLVVAVDENTDGYTFSGSFYTTDVSGMRSILYRNDNNNPDPTTISENTIGQSSIPNIALDFNAILCQGPSDLSVGNIMSDAVDLNWTAGGSETSWNIEYGVSGFALGAGTSQVVNTVNHNISSLMPASDYEYYVQANCGGGTSAWVGPFTFTTACAAITALPFSEDFEGITSGQPNCWGITGTTTSSTYHWSSYYDGYEGRGMRFNSAYNSDGNTSELSTPMLDLTSLTNAQLRFYFKNATGGDFEVLVSNDAGATFTSLESGLTGYTDWTQKVYDLTPYIDTDVIIRFKGTSNYDFSSYLYLDSVLIQETPSCEVPYGLEVTNVSATSAQLGWTAGSGQTAWEVEYGLTGFTQGDGTAVAAGTNPFEISTLTPDTTYEFYVRANCGGEYSAWAGPFEFTTPCLPYTIPFVEGFESGYTHNTDVTGCLVQESDFGSNVWTANNTLTSYNRAPRTGEWNVFLRYNNRDWIFIPVSLTSGQSYTVDVYARQDGSNASNASITISYGNAANEAAMTNEILVETGIINGDYQKLSNHFVPAADGVYYVGIKGDINNSPYYISIDDIRIDVSPDCLEPSDLIVSNIMDVTATLGWTASGSELLWDVEYGLDGFTQGEGTMVNDVNANSYNATGLTANTDYQFYVRANCGTETSVWAGPFDFTTNCSAFTAPYMQNFDGTSAPNVDACWSTDIVGGTSSYAAVETTTFNELSSPNSLKFQNSSDNDGDYYLISPRFSDLDATKRIKFQIYKNFSSDDNSGLFELGVMTDASDYNTFVNVYTFDVADFDEDAWKQIYVNLDAYAGGAGHIVFKYQPGTSDYKVLYIDDFVYEVAPISVPACTTNLQNVPTDANCGNRGVQLSWDAVSEADGYRLTIGTSAGGNDILDQQDMFDTLTYDLNETLIATTYYWTVTPYNTNGDAAACSETSFTTALEACVCVPVFTGSNSESTYINNFSTTNAEVNIDNSGSGFATNGYGNYYDAMGITVTENSSFDFTLALEGGSVGIAVWIDWNQDASFDPSTELVYETGGWEYGPITETITVPASTANGDYRMRVIIDYNDSTPGDNPCEFNNTRAEAEDYKLTVDNTLSIAGNTIEEFKYYPNPVKQTLNVSAKHNLTQINVYNMIGQEVMSETISQRQYQLDMSELTTGMYMVKVSSDTVSKTFKILKR
jgi:hypothetical protein